MFIKIPLKFMHSTWENDIVLNYAFSIYEFKI